jgi:GMP synthase-like glutamine amidotransferase
VNVLSVVHPGDAGSELFAPVVVGLGHRFDEWTFAEGKPPPLDAYDAVLVFGGAMHVDQEEQHPWLRDESDWLGALIEGAKPTLGICLGSQLIARAAGARVGPLAEPERSRLRSAQRRYRGFASARAAGACSSTRR